MLLTAHKLLLRSSLTAAGPCLDSPAPLPGPGGHDPGSSSGQGVVKAGRLRTLLSAAVLPSLSPARSSDIRHQTVFSPLFTVPDKRDSGRRRGGSLRRCARPRLFPWRMSDTWRTEWKNCRSWTPGTGTFADLAAQTWPNKAGSDAPLSQPANCLS